MIYATTRTKIIFKFNTNVSSTVENTMAIMGYGCEDYNLSFYPTNDGSYSMIEVKPILIGEYEKMDK